jgi:hypothetical protein
MGTDARRRDRRLDTPETPRFQTTEAVFERLTNFEYLMPRHQELRRSLDSTLIWLTANAADG